MKKRPIGIKDIAKAVGVSTSTVSRALRDTYDVNPETREKVLKVAKELNYKPNLHAKALSSGQSKNIAVVIPFITNYYFSTVISGIQEVAYNAGYNLILLVTNDDADREQAMINNLSIANLDGLLISISSNSVMIHHFTQLINDGVPIVFFDRAPKEIKTTKVLQNDYQGAYDATIHLIQKGYSKIAHIAGNQQLDFTQDRLKGYISALKACKKEINHEWIIFSGFSQESGYIDTQKLLSLPNKPDAIFAVNDRKAVGAILALKEHHLTVGKSFGVIGFTNDPIATIVTPTLSTIEEPAFEIGKKSCELLIKHIQNKSLKPQHIVLPSKLIVRESSQIKP